MIFFATGFFAAFCFALAFTPLVMKLARRLGFVDAPSARKMHSVPIPRIGGIAIIGALALVVVPMILVSDRLHGQFRISRGALAALFISATMVFLVGLIDDLKHVPSKLKLFIILAAAMIACKGGVRIDHFALGDLFSINLNWMVWPLSIMWIAGFTVSIAFIDGLDGLAGGIAAIACAVIACVAGYHGETILVLLSLSLLGALGGFLVFNVHPAKVFMGDCGSLTTGFILGCTSIMCAGKAETITVLALPALALGVPIFDVFLTLIRRGILQRRSLFSAERGHVHHRMMDMGLNQRQVVLVLHVVTAAAAGAGLLVFRHPTFLTVTLLGLTILAMLAIFRSAGSVRVRDTLRAVKHNLHRRRHHSNARGVFEDMQTRFRLAKTFDAWWAEVCAAADQLSFTRITMVVPTRDGTERTQSWEREGVSDGTDVVTATIPIRHRRIGPALKAHIQVATAGSLEAAGQRMASFSRLMEEHSLAELPDDLIQPPKKSRNLLLRLAGATHGSRNGNGHAHGKIANEQIYPRLSIEELGVNMGAGDISSLHDALNPSTKIAVVHDFLYTYAGAERVLEQILRVFPHADLFSLFDFLPEHERGFILNKSVNTTFIQRLPFAKHMHRVYLPFMPLAIEQLDLSAYDVVISSSYVTAKGVITKPDQLHMCYCHSPVRYAWDLQGQYLSQAGMVKGLKSVLARVILHYIRNWDVRSSTGVDRFITNSDFVGRRVQKTYRRESKTIYPPVDIENFALHTEKEDFYLTVSRLVPYKKIDVIVEAFSKLPDRRLIVVGEGPDAEKIRQKAGPNVKVMGHQSADNLLNYMQRARAFIFAAEEDFGIVPVEAQACGTPVIAYGKGGAVESIVHGRTGILFDEQSPDCIANAVHEFERRTWQPELIRQNAARFSIERFRRELANHVRTEWASFCRKRPNRPQLESLADLAEGADASEITAIAE